MTQATILVVEDEGIVAQEIKSRLEKSGYTVCAVAHDGRTAIAHAGERRPDLVLMDIRLKGEMDGIEAAGVIRDRFNLPVVYLGAGQSHGALRLRGQAFRNPQPDGLH